MTSIFFTLHKNLCLIKILGLTYLYDAKVFKKSDFFKKCVENNIGTLTILVENIFFRQISCGEDTTRGQPCLMSNVSYLQDLEGIHFMWQKGIFFKTKTGDILVELYENKGSKTLSIKAKTNDLIEKMREYLRCF